MTELKRYDCDVLLLRGEVPVEAPPRESPDGEYVLFTDYSAKCADYERLREALEKIRDTVKSNLDCHHPVEDEDECGDLDDCMLHGLVAMVENALTPAAPCATTSSEIVAARKAEESSSGGRK